MHTRAKGKLAEQAACDYLRSEGYQIIQTNFYARWSEIDIVAKQGSEIVFCEVKSLRPKLSQDLYYTVSATKRQRLAKAINLWLLSHKQMSSSYRLDFIGVIANSQHEILEIKHFTHI